MRKKKEQVFDFSKILKSYEDMWVALSKDNQKVIESAKTLAELFEKLKDKDYRNFEFMKVPEFNFCYAPFFL